MLPGEHPHSDRPNWRPAETVEEYLHNIREGLENHSIERMTKLLDINRTLGWRARQMTYIPEALFGRLAKAGIATRQLAQIGQVFRDGNGNVPAEIERCPHCGARTAESRKSCTEKPKHFSVCLVLICCTDRALKPH
jgi:hypothetical protein